MLARASLREERVEGVVSAADRLIAGHLSIRLDAMLQAEQFPTRVANLDASLPNVDADRLAHGVLELSSPRVFRKCCRWWARARTRLVFTECTRVKCAPRSQKP